MDRFFKIGDSYYNVDMIAKIRVIKPPDGDGKNGHARVHWRDGAFEDVNDGKAIEQLVGLAEKGGKTDY